MRYKDFVACIYLENQKAVKNLSDRSILSTDPAALAEYYNEQGFDAILVFDLSVTDKAHEDALSVIKRICDISQI
ncbi:MAG: bifunctional phosphoribosyl-AMP cyclohydrolase/phosphoribosyl-ATP pyrophosphatase, partial [Lachnospiraceae bacterium]|nr:bifunctional phosphoribosyl-AMP cyclohydrolase/phosphoribosyl-ATP pyrophosphatase [Lachnospiraceae bacterium]